MTEHLADKKSVPCCSSITQDKERRLHALEQELIAAAKGPTIKLTVTEIRKKGLLAALRDQTGR
jgi:polyisoprenoid-binding protein YceI